MTTIKIIFSIIAAITAFQNTRAQVSTDWISIYHFSYDEAKAIATDTAGNVYVTGSSGTDYATVKYNSNGIQQWAARYSSGGAAAISTDKSGNVYVTGGSAGDFATVKYNSNGVQQWAARFGSTGNDGGFSIAVDDSGNVFVTGIYYNTTPGLQNYNFMTVKYNSSGSLQWAKEYDGGFYAPDYAYKLALDNSGNVYVTGDSRGPGSNDDDFIIIKYNSSGAVQWIRTYNGPGDAFDNVKAIAVDKYNNVYITGRSDGGTSTRYDFCTIKYNSLGDSLWLRRFNGAENNFDISTGVAADTSGNVYVTGISLNSISNYDFLTVKYNSNGAEQWFRIFDGPGNSADYANSISVDASGNCFITGASNLPGSNFNYATVKYNSGGEECWNRIYSGTANGSDEAFAISVDGKGNTIVTGGSAGAGTSRDFVTIKYSPANHVSLTVIMQGLYNSITNSMISDTIKVQLRNSYSPYNIVDSSESEINFSGNGVFYFTNANNTNSYYIVIKHRNSIETWSSAGNYFLPDSLIYDFTIASSKAYGNNQIQIDTSPLRFAIYTGDVNQDGSVDLTDNQLIDNDSYNFVTGYVNTDLNGDGFVDVTDAALAGNNSFNYVSKITP